MNLLAFLMTLALVFAPVGSVALGQQNLTDPSVVKIKTDVEKRLRSDLRQDLQS